MTFRERRELMPASAFLNAILCRYSIGPPFEDPEPQTGGFSGARVWKVVTADGAYCLRAWPESVSIPRVAGLHRLLAHIGADGVRTVAVPISSRDGTTWIEHHGRLWHLEPWMPGTADFRSSPTDARLSSAMRRLAEWHLAARTFRAHPPETPWLSCAARATPESISSRFSLAARYHRHAEKWVAEASRIEGLLREPLQRVAHHFLRLRCTVATQLAAVQVVQVRVHPCLRDVWHDHVLYTGEDVTGLIDPAAARSDTIAADLSRLLGSFLGTDASRWNFALHEYSAHNPLTSDEMRLVPILDLSGLVLSGARWLDRILSQQERLERPAAVAGRLKQIADRLDTVPSEPL